MSILRKIETWLKRPIEKNFLVLIRKLRRFYILVYEKICGYDFSGVIKNTDLNGSSESLANATAYQAYYPDSTISLVQELVGLDSEFVRFIDVGCGKGRQCIHVARRFAFSEVLGMDFDCDLVSIANENLSLAGEDVASRTKFLVADARHWRLPAGKNIVFLFNPFDSELLSKFIANNISNFRDHGSVLIYASDNCRKVIQAAGFDVIFRSLEIRSSFFVYGDKFN